MPAPGNRMPLTAIKSAVSPGKSYDVTDHRAGPSGSGTARRTVTRVTAGRFYLSYPHHGVPHVDWPRAAQAEMDADGTIRLYGGPGQQPGELFLTLVPARDVTRRPRRRPATSGTAGPGISPAPT